MAASLPAYDLIPLPGEGPEDVVVGSDELKARSRRAATLRAMLAYAGKPVAAFPGRRDGRGSGVEIYRFEPPESWEGVAP